MISCVLILAPRGDATSFMMCFRRVWEASQQAESTGGIYLCIACKRCYKNYVWLIDNRGDLLYNKGDLFDWR